MGCLHDIHALITECDDQNLLTCLTPQKYDYSHTCSDKCATGFNYHILQVFSFDVWLHWGRNTYIAKSFLFALEISFQDEIHTKLPQ